LRRRAGRPQLKRDPLGGITTGRRFLSMNRSLVSLLLLAACSSWTAPADELRLSLTVDRQAVSLGDTVTFTVFAFNPTDRTIDLAPRGCGHSLVALVTEPTGRYQRLWDGSWICILFDDNMLAPGETDSVVWKWVARPVPGAYSVRGGVARGAELANPTPPLTVQVQ
jgi:hypothetical protein